MPLVTPPGKKAIQVPLSCGRGFLQTYVTDVIRLMILRSRQAITGTIVWFGKRARGRTIGERHVGDVDLCQMGKASWPTIGTASSAGHARRPTVCLASVTNTLSRVALFVHGASVLLTLRTESSGTTQAKG